MSLRVRLLLAVIGVALVALVVADIATYQALRSFLERRLDQALEEVHPQIERAVDDGSSVNPNEILAIAPGVYVEVRDPGGRVLVDGRLARPGADTGRPQLPDSLGGPLQATGPGDPHRYFTVSGGPGHPAYRVRASVLGSGDLLYLALPLEEVSETLHRLLLIELTVTVVSVAVAAAIGWWLVGIGLRPLRAVERTAGAIADGNFAERVPGADRPTEVGRLAAALNAMLADIDAAFGERDATEAALRRSEERLRRFVADASHELRTPLAAVSAYTELIERAGDHHPDDVSRARAGIRRETVRMGRLVDDLLLLARLDEGLPLDRRPLDLVALVGEAVEAHRAVAPAWPVELRAARPYEVVGDATRLRQVVDNLLANVAAHTPAGTTTEVSVRRMDGGRSVGAVEPFPVGPLLDGPAAQRSDVVEVVVTDHGPGLDGAAAARVFERFYRADASRSRARGGSGLGLAIVASIAAAHGGSARAQPTPGGGLTIVVSLPSVDDREPVEATVASSSAAGSGPGSGPVPATATDPGPLGVGDLFT